MAGVLPIGLRGYLGKVHRERLENGLKSSHLTYQSLECSSLKMMN
jgi:hypothetical protein